MNNKEIQDLIKLVSKSELSEVNITKGDFKILLRSKDYYKNKNQGATPNYIPMPMSAGTPALADPAPAPAPASTLQNAPAQEASESKASATEDNANYLEVKSPIVGTFYRSASPDKPSFIKVGDKINAGDTVCIVEAMKLFNEIETEVSGTVVKVLVEDASPVEYDQVLFLVDPNS